MKEIENANKGRSGASNKLPGAYASRDTRSLALYQRENAPLGSDNASSRWESNRSAPGFRARDESVIVPAEFICKSFSVRSAVRNGRCSALRAERTADNGTVDLLSLERLCFQALLARRTIAEEISVAQLRDSVSLAQDRRSE